MNSLAGAAANNDELALSAYKIAWDYLLGTGYEDCIGHQVAVVGYINDAIDRGVRHQLIIANRAITDFQRAKAEVAALQAGVFPT